MWKDLDIIAKLRKYLQQCCNKELARLVRIFRMFKEDDCLLWASSISFSTLFAMLPLMVLAFSLLKTFGFFTAYRESILGFLFRNFLVQNEPRIQEYFNIYFEKGYEVNIFGLVSFIITSMFWLSSIEHALNNVWKVKENRPFLERFPIYWTVITLVPVLFGVSFYLTSNLSSYFHLYESYWRYVFEFTLPIFLSWFIFFLIYKLVPRYLVATRPAIIGGFVAAILWEIAKRSFNYYTRELASYEKLYGLLGAIFSFLLWTEVTWIILLFCAEIAYDIEYGEIYQKKLEEEREPARKSEKEK